ncbi:polycystic kidney disease protein 1-like 2 [Patella vulgata]|uniref:polycystic kidney disease protein 1-like 2 n=1 Tax=Patella vulgata TaxID=6465 RepID=UPI0024A87F62|nr:polycystic kidney disease protein 1-like 2 [Patella vulgata]
MEVNGTDPLSNVHINTSFSGNAYGVLLTTDGCRVWDDDVETWDPKACTVSPYSTPDETICVCDDPPGTAFASAFYVPPNTIDFDVIWTKFDISNAAVYGTLIAVLIVYGFILIWARRMDEKDLDRWRVGYLRDNLVDDKYFYLITVYTGLRKNAGTQSGIHFVLAGEYGDTGARSLYDGKRNFDTGSVMNLICSTSVDLGDLSYFRVWHDNTGRGASASWFLGKMIVQDLQNQKRYIFENNRWLGVDKDDGMVDRLVPVTSQDDLMTFDKLFSSHARLNLTDSHLWLSVFMRPDKSTFSRVQRVSCCLALLFLTMIVNAMFFESENETTDEETVRQEFQIGILRFSMSTIFTSFISVIITVPPTVLLVFLFKSSKPSKNYFKVKPKSGCCLCCKKPGKSDNLVVVEGDEVLDNMDDEKLLPHYCIIIAWILVAVIVMVCAFFLLLYSMQWGKPISEEWLTSFFLAFVENMFVLDPMKVLMISVLLALCARSPYNHSGKVDVSKVKTDVKKFGLGEVDLSQLPPDPIPETLLEKAKERRKQELKAQAVFLDLILYAVFLFGLYCVCYGNRDTQSFAFNSHIKTVIFTDSFEQIKSHDDFFEWVDKTMIPAMFPTGDFRGNALDWRRKLFFDDHVNFRVGPARLRQVRIKQRPIPFYGSKYGKLMENYKYYWPYSSSKEETTPFCPGWTPQPCALDVRLSSSTLDAWLYTTSEESWGSSTSGNLEVYDGGGYFLELSINKDISKAMIEEIKTNGWLDRQTRAVFVEFSLYNANNNLLTVVRLIAEFPEFGSVITWKHISTLRVFQNVGPIGAFIILCEVIVVIILFVFGFKCLKRLFKQRLGYFGSFWNIVDLITLITTLVTIVFFILREVYTSKTLEIFRVDPKKFVNFEHIVLWDALFVYGLSFLVFTATIGMLRILGYNRRFTMIGEVLRVSAKDLIGFTSVFAIFYSAFIASGYVLFATSLYQFRSAFDTAITIFIYLLGKNQLGKRLVQSDEYSVIYFFALVFFVIFILLTMFQVIMNNSMTVVRSSVTSIPAPYGIVNVLTGIYKSLISDWIPSGFLQKKDERAVEEMEARRQRSQVHNILESFKDQFEKSMDVKGASANYKQGFFNLGARLEEEEEEMYTFPRQNPGTSFP